MFYSVAPELFHIYNQVHPAFLLPPDIPELCSTAAGLLRRGSPPTGHRTAYGPPPVSPWTSLAPPRLPAGFLPTLHAAPQFTAAASQLRRPQSHGVTPVLLWSTASPLPQVTREVQPPPAPPLLDSRMRATPPRHTTPPAAVENQMPSPFRPFLLSSSIHNFFWYSSTLSLAYKRLGQAPSPANFSLPLFHRRRASIHRGPAATALSRLLQHTNKLHRVPVRLIHPTSSSFPHRNHPVAVQPRRRALSSADDPLPGHPRPLQPHPEVRLSSLMLNDPSVLAAGDHHRQILPVNAAIPL